MLDILISERIRGAAAGALSSRFDVAILPELLRPGSICVAGKHLLHSV